MKKLIAFLLLLSTTTFGGAGIFVQGTPTTNPAASTVLATTVSLVSGSANNSANYHIQIIVSSTATTATTFDMQTIIGGSVVSHFYAIVGSAGGTTSITTPFSFPIPDGTVFQIVNVGAVTGIVQANIAYNVGTFN
jgi:hypothetical protein